MDKLRALRYFISLADTLSFRETAERFNVPASSVSRRITDLEQELGVLLFQRSTRSVRLTDLGKLYLEDINHAVRIIDTADEQVSQQSASASGVLRITCLPGYGEVCVLPVLEQLRIEYPDIVFDMDFTDKIVDLAADAIDLAIRVVSSDLPENLVARKLTEQRYVLAGSPAYLLQQGMPEKIEDLQGFAALCYRGPHGVMRWQYRSEAGWQVLELPAALISNHLQSLIQEAVNGNGITFLPYWSLKEYLDDGTLTEIRIPDVQLAVNGTTDGAIYLLYHSPKFRLQKVKLAVDSLLDALADR